MKMIYVYVQDTMADWERRIMHWRSFTPDAFSMLRRSRCA